jgi:hypothetical protein
MSHNSGKLIQLLYVDRALSRDPSIYKDAETFNPDRFFDEDGHLNNDDSSYTFGFGRRLVFSCSSPRKNINCRILCTLEPRKCPGLHMGRATVGRIYDISRSYLTLFIKVWLSIATTLWAFNIGKAKDASGKDVAISGEYSDGMIR